MFKKSMMALAVGALALGAAAQAVAAKEEVRVGILVAKSGPAAFLGAPGDNGLKLLLEDINKRGGLDGHPVKAVTYDTEGNSTKAVQLFHRLVDSDHVQVVFGPSTSGECMSIVPVANQVKVPLLCMAGAEAVINPVTKFAFKIPPNDRVAVDALLTEFKKRHFKNIALIHATDGYGQAGAAVIKQEVGKFGLKLNSVEQFGPRDTSMTAQLIRIRDSKPDALMVWAINPGPTIVLKEAKAMGFKPPVYLSFSSASKQLIDQTGPAAEGSYVVSPRVLVPETMPASNTQKANIIRYSQEYAKRYGVALDSFSAHPFDNWMLLEAALKKIKGPVNGPAIANALESVNACGANGCYHISPKNHNGITMQDMGVYQDVHGQWALVK